MPAGDTKLPDVVDPRYTSKHENTDLVRGGIIGSGICNSGTKFLELTCNAVLFNNGGGMMG